MNKGLTGFLGLTIPLRKGKKSFYNLITKYVWKLTHMVSSKKYYTVSWLLIQQLISWNWGISSLLSRYRHHLLIKNVIYNSSRHFWACAQDIRSRFPNPSFALMALKWLAFQSSNGREHVTHSVLKYRGQYKCSPTTKDPTTFTQMSHQEAVGMQGVCRSEAFVLSGIPKNDCTQKGLSAL